ncbi:uncharacterized protein LOC101848404 [Aplysia californica]|uniref:Uncharacterized protein LOC101848404 n=1 Tax=Aplysia californica TaxID=6500 RepID=A0ABM0JCX5_APLCA|nr:uncharacterized protein LOC101848404 [Aplysia californica]
MASAVLAQPSSLLTSTTGLFHAQARRNTKTFISERASTQTSTESELAQLLHCYLMTKGVVPRRSESCSDSMRPVTSAELFVRELLSLARSTTNGQMPAGWSCAQDVRGDAGGDQDRNACISDSTPHSYHPNLGGTGNPSSDPSTGPSSVCELQQHSSLNVGNMHATVPHYTQGNSSPVKCSVVASSALDTRQGGSVKDSGVALRVPALLAAGADVFPSQAPSLERPSLASDIRLSTGSSKSRAQLQCCPSGLATGGLSACGSQSVLKNAVSSVHPGLSVNYDAIRASSVSSREPGSTVPNFLLDGCDDYARTRLPSSHTAAPTWNDLPSLGLQASTSQSLNCEQSTPVLEASSQSVMQICLPGSSHTLFVDGVRATEEKTGSPQPIRNNQMGHVSASCILPQVSSAEQPGTLWRDRSNFLQHPASAACLTVSSHHTSLPQSLTHTFASSHSSGPERPCSTIVNSQRHLMGAKSQFQTNSSHGDIDDGPLWLSDRDFSTNRSVFVSCSPQFSYQSELRAESDKCLRDEDDLAFSAAEESLIDVESDSHVAETDCPNLNQIQHEIDKHNVQSDTQLWHSHCPLRRSALPHVDGIVKSMKDAENKEKTAPVLQSRSHSIHIVSSNANSASDTMSPGNVGALHRIRVTASSGILEAASKFHGLTSFAIVGKSSKIPVITSSEIVGETSEVPVTASSRILRAESKFPGSMSSEYVEETSEMLVPTSSGIASSSTSPAWDTCPAPISTPIRSAKIHNMKNQGELLYVAVGQGVCRFASEHPMTRGVRLHKGKREVKRQLVRLRRRSDLDLQETLVTWRRGKEVLERNRFDDFFELTADGLCEQAEVHACRRRDQYVVNWYVWCPGHGNCRRKCGGFGICLENCRGIQHKQDRHNCSLMINMKLFISDLSTWRIHLTGSHVPPDSSVTWMPPPPKTRHTGPKSTKPNPQGQGSPEKKSGEKLYTDPAGENPPSEKDASFIESSQPVRSSSLVLSQAAFEPTSNYPSKKRISKMLSALKRRRGQRPYNYRNFMNRKAAGSQSVGNKSSTCNSIVFSSSEDVLKKQDGAMCDNNAFESDVAVMRGKKKVADVFSLPSPLPASGSLVSQPETSFVSDSKQISLEDGNLLSNNGRLCDGQDLSVSFGVDSALSTCSTFDVSEQSLVPTSQSNGQLLVPKAGSLNVTSPTATFTDESSSLADIQASLQVPSSEQERLLNEVVGLCAHSMDFPASDSCSRSTLCLPPEREVIPERSQYDQPFLSANSLTDILQQVNSGLRSQLLDSSEASHDQVSDQTQWSVTLSGDQTPVHSQLRTPGGSVPVGGHLNFPQWPDDHLGPSSPSPAPDAERLSPCCASAPVLPPTGEDGAVALYSQLGGVCSSSGVEQHTETSVTTASQGLVPVSPHHAVLVSEALPSYQEAAAALIARQRMGDLH